MCRDDQPERAPDPPDLLDRDRIGERIETGATLVLRDGDAQPAQITDAPNDLGRESSLAFVLVDDRCDLADHEVADGIPQQDVLRREVEIHRVRERTPARRIWETSASLHRCPSPSSRCRLRGASTRRVGDDVARGASNLRRELLLRLRLDGPSSPDQLATRLGASRTGVLQQLRALELAHLVSRQTVRHGVGRPRHLYDVTPDAQDLFPQTYDALAAGLLAAIGAVGGTSCWTRCSPRAVGS